MARWIGWVAIDAPDVETARRRLDINLAGAGVVERVQSRASWEISQEELQTAKRRRKIPEE